MRHLQYRSKQTIRCKTSTTDTNRTFQWKMKPISNCYGCLKTYWAKNNWPIRTQISVKLWATNFFHVFSKISWFTYRVSQKDRYGQIWPFHNSKRYFHGIEDWLGICLHKHNITFCILLFIFEKIHFAHDFHYSINPCSINAFNQNIVYFIIQLVEVSFDILLLFRPFLVSEQLTNVWEIYI